MREKAFTIFFSYSFLKLSFTDNSKYWRSRDELIRDVLLWTPTHGRAKAGRPARTYIQKLCEDTRCCPEDLPRAMNDREEWRVRVRDICATSATWWYIYIYKCVCVCVCVCVHMYILYIYIYIYIYVHHNLSTYIYIYISYIMVYSTIVSWPSRLGLQNTPCASVLRVKTPLMSVLLWR